MRSLKVRLIQILLSLYLPKLWKHVFLMVILQYKLVTLPYLLVHFQAVLVISLQMGHAALAAIAGIIALAAIAGIIVRGRLWVGSPLLGTCSAGYLGVAPQCPSGDMSHWIPHMSLLCYLSAPSCLCTMFTNYEDNHVNRLGAHKLAIASCSHCTCAYL